MRISLILALAAAAGCADAAGAPPASRWTGFANPVSYDADASILTRLAFADVTGDARPDLLLVARSDQSVRVLRGTGAGSFASATQVSIGSDTRDVTTADVNGDGTSDLVATGHFDNALFVRLGIRPRDFADQTSYPLRNHGHFVLRANLNGDRYDDIVAIHDGSGQPVYVTAFLGTLDGLVRTSEIATTTYTAKGLARGDFDADGRTDIAVAVADNRASALVLRGRGDGTFDAPTPIATLSSDPMLSDGTTAIAVADFDRDGRDDLVLARQDAANELVVRLARDSFAAPLRMALHSPVTVGLGDVDGDGRLDVLAGNLEQGSIALLRGAGDGTFAAPRTFPVGQSAAWVAVVDLDGDGRADVAAADLIDHRVRVLLSR